MQNKAETLNHFFFSSKKKCCCSISGASGGRWRDPTVEDGGGEEETEEDEEQAGSVREVQTLLYKSLSADTGGQFTHYASVGCECPRAPL